jgi:ABC-type Fe3+-hydroxamate transport system substrate-binding protein
MIFTDQTGFEVKLAATPQRIISLVPSQSEYLWDLDLRKELVGITKFCIHPDEMFRTLDRVGGTKQLNLEKTRELKPDLIIGNKEENTKEQIEELRKEFPVWLSDINTLDDAVRMLEQVGAMVGRSKQAEEIIRSVKNSLNACVNLFKGQSAIYFIWQEPYMLVGSNTFIHSVMEHVGFQNLVADRTRYPELRLEELQSLKPAYCLLSTEPFPFSQKHVTEMQALLPDSTVVLVDGEMFSWYGSRLQRVNDYMQALAGRFYK